MPSLNLLHQNRLFKLPTLNLPHQNRLCIGTKAALSFWINISTFSEVRCDCHGLGLVARIEASILVFDTKQVLYWPVLGLIQFCSFDRRCKTCLDTKPVLYQGRFCSLTVTRPQWVKRISKILSIIKLSIVGVFLRHEPWNFVRPMNIMNILVLQVRVTEHKRYVFYFAYPAYWIITNIKALFGKTDLYVSAFDTIIDISVARVNVWWSPDFPIILPMMGRY